MLKLAQLVSMNHSGVELIHLNQDLHVFHYQAVIGEISVPGAYLFLSLRYFNNDCTHSRFILSYHKISCIPCSKTMAAAQMTEEVKIFPLLRDSCCGYCFARSDEMINPLALPCGHPQCKECIELDLAMNFDAQCKVCKLV